LLVSENPLQDSYAFSLPRVLYLPRVAITRKRVKHHLMLKVTPSNKPLWATS
jgi:hypothetical protein